MEPTGSLPADPLEPEEPGNRVVWILLISVAVVFALIIIVSLLGPDGS